MTALQDDTGQLWWQGADPHEADTAKRVGHVVDHALGDWVLDQLQYGRHDLHHVKAKLVEAVGILDAQGLVDNPVRTVFRRGP